ncbi:MULTISPECIES: DUF3105 domain-containing protein [Priestia]|uniref:DUF3105 domain-containing protein n=1 Tax=Priestia TaxID=2800373 RepID=UPI0023314DF4|nr:DUF3105 domain-containing protein [Priestia sp. AB]MDC0706647.1 DUF3105 domain-containing protein [Priestia sp. AB]
MKALRNEKILIQKSNTNHKKKKIIVVLASILATLILFLIGFSYLGYKAKLQNIEFLDQNTDIDVKTFPSEGRKHTKEKVTYKTFPPTSGNHNPTPADYGFYKSPVPFENLVHSLEHGDIVIYYNASLLKKNELKQLKELSEIIYKGSGIEVVPNSQIKEAVVLTAWTKMLNLQSFNEKKIKQFIYDYIYKGPEKIDHR